MNHIELGAKGEKLAQEYLKKRGYQILDTNFKCKFGEVDIVATKDGEVSFVEVKTRSQELFGRPAEAVGFVKQRHIYKVAEFYILTNHLKDVPISLDVIEVYIFNKSKPRVIHMRNAIIERPYMLRKGARYAHY